MRNLKFVPLLFLVLCCFASSCATTSADTSSVGDRLPEHTGEADKPQPAKLPMFVMGDKSGKYKVTFIWSYACEKCQREFKDIFDIFLRARDKKDITLAFIQYEESTDVIKHEITDAVCSGEKMYELSMWEYLFHGYTFNKTNSLIGAADIPRETCNDRLLEQVYLMEYFKTLRNNVGKEIDNMPIIIFNGELIKTTNALHRKLATAIKAN